MKSTVWICGAILLAGAVEWTGAESLRIDHEDTDITALTQAQVDRAKSVLHIAYGHTSHGSQLTTGMNGLVDFANGGGLGLNLSSNAFDWNHGGSGSALDLHDYAMGGDVGYYPQWVVNTSNYLNDTAHSNVNVIIWSWCGQMPGKYSNGTLTNEYLAPMAQFEADYPDVVFVYMTGHVDIGDDADQKAACEVIRNWCSVSNRVLYDFSDIEHYDPDGTYFEFVRDNCGIYDSAGGSPIGNWATNWQGSHTEDVDWYDCTSAHSEPLNANRKAYAAWALWCQLAADLDRDTLADAWEERFGGIHLFGSGTNNYDGDAMTDWEEYVLDSSPTNSAPRFAIEHLIPTSSASVQFPSSTGRVYSLRTCSNLLVETWTNLVSQPGMGGTMTLTHTNPPVGCHAYGIGVSLPE